VRADPTDSIGNDGSDTGIFAQRFDATGVTHSGEFQVNSYTTNDQFMPSVAIDRAGDFVITWTSDLQDGNSLGVYAQRYDGGGSRQSNEFHVNTYTTDARFSPTAAIDGVGDFVIAWESNLQNGDFYGIFAQHYQVDVAPVLSQVEANFLNAIASQTTPVTSTLSTFDQDNNTWAGATIQISINYQSGQDVLGFTNIGTINGSWNASTGTLTLSGTDTISNYRAALRNVTYHNTSGSPNTSAIRTIEFQANDGFLLSNVVTRDLTVATASAPAVLAGVSGTGTYFENATPLALGPNLTINDPDSLTLASATVSFVGWQSEDRTDFNKIFALPHVFTQDLVAHTALFTINGVDTVDHYQTLLQSVVYWDVSNNPNTTTRVATFQVNDGQTNSNPVTRNTIAGPINDLPLFSAIESNALFYKANDPAFPPQSISSTLLIGDADSNNLTQATIQISAGYQNNVNGHDLLSFTNQLGIVGSFSAATATLTLMGNTSVSNYRTAIRSVAFSSSGTNVSTANRTLSIIGTDDSGTGTAISLAITRTVTVSTTNLPPALTGVPTTALAYVRGTAPVLVAPNALVLDSDSINLTSATIQVTGNYQNGQDVLAGTSALGVTTSFNAVTGTLTLSGQSSLANYQTILQSVTYKTNTAGASTLTRTLTFILNDGLTTGSTVTRNITLT